MQPARPQPDPSWFALTVDIVLQEFKGDHRGAIHALLHDLWVLAGDFAEAVSLGYVRGEMSAGAERVRVKQRIARQP